ncbi:MAG: hypothetical protein Q9172_007723 [Xanthocarpia lactea]
MFVTVVFRYLCVLCALASVVAFPRSCIHDKTIASPVIPADDNNCSSNYNLTTPAPPFPELYALPGTTQSAFIHVKYVWEPMVREDYVAVSRDFMLGLTSVIRHRGDVKLPNEGVSKKHGNLELMDKPDGYMILINEEAPPPPNLLRIKGLERDEPLLPLHDK